MINREILMTIVKNSSNRLEGEQEILEINEQQLHLICKELNKLFSLHGVVKSLPTKKEIIFDDSLMAEIETKDKNLKVLRAVNGWGNAIDIAKVQVNDK